MNGDDNKFYGKYRGTVFNNIDPLQMGRLQAQVPDVLGIIPSTWAMPAAPLAGIQMGVYVVPPIGAGIWVEFEQGDVNYPVWSGCWWGSAAEVPALALAAPPALQNIVLQTTGQNTILISDVPGPTGGILLKTRAGAFLSISDTGIIISDGKGGMITMTGGVVTVNQGALLIK